ncbi:MAG: helix-turn-helix transcriptional regulator [Clostridia bacterium]|nr:helix-turn-helix transcriptional regulator [Clostridia bacterium]
MSIGSKIKRLRKKRGMTQAELSDGIITRGMLSRIESGSAVPSMQSLDAIASRLEVSPSFLLEAGDDILPAEYARVKKAIETEYRAKNFKECYEIFSLWTSVDDPTLSTIFATTAFEVALNAFYVGNFVKSKEILKEIEQLLPTLLIISPYANQKRIDFLLNVIEHIDNLETAVELADNIPDFEFSPSVFFIMLKLIKAGRHAECNTLMEFCALDDCYTEYISAQLTIKDYKFIDAIIIMKSLIAKKDCPVFLKLLCLNSIENCCKLCEDYKGAYENHLAYQTLLSEIKR